MEHQFQPTSTSTEYIPVHLVDIYSATAIERDWWPTSSKFPTISSEQSALDSGALVVVPPFGEAWRLIRRLNGTKEGEPNSLRPEALDLLNRIGRYCRQNGLPDHIALAVTSLYRSLDLQAKLNGRQAVVGIDSSHLAGAAFDFSLRSYYFDTGTRLIPVNNWSGQSGLYLPEYTQILTRVATDFQDRGECNAVIEKKVEVNGQEIPSVLHICLNPFY